MRIPLLVLGLIAAPAAAQMGPPPGGQGAPPAQRQLPDRPTATILVEPVGMAIAAFDSNLDGKTTRAELIAGIARSFAAIDTSGAGYFGYIGYGDWSKLWLGDSNALPSQFEVDANHDNRITLDELQDQFAKAFDRLDADKDGSVTRSEVLTIRAAGLGGGPGGRGFSAGPGRGRRGGGMPPGQ